MPFVSPVTTKGLVAPVCVLLAAPVAAHVAVKVAAVPPLVDDVKATVICVAPAVTEVILGVPGFTVAAGVTAAAEEAAPVPALLVALTVQEYKLPLVRPVTTTGLDVFVAVMAVAVPVWQDAV